MNMIKAFEETLALARQQDLDDMGSDTPDADYAHLEEMLEKIKNNPEEFSDTAKLGRWLGWAQACVYIMSGGEISLAELREINKSCE